MLGGTKRLLAPPLSPLTARRVCQHVREPSHPCCQSPLYISAGLSQCCLTFFDEPSWGAELDPLTSSEQVFEAL